MMISNQYDNNFEEGISTYIKRLDIDKVELLDELGAENIKLRTDESNQFYMSSLESDDKGVVIADKFCQWFTEEDNNKKIAAPPLANDEISFDAAIMKIDDQIYKGKMILHTILV